MILAFKYVPPEAHDTEPCWARDPLVADDLDALGFYPDGEYAVFVPTKSTIDGPEVTNPLPASFKFERIVKVTTPPPQPKVTTV